MSKIFIVSFFSGPVYQVKAENEEEAIQKAENFFYDVFRTLKCMRLRKEKNKCKTKLKT